VAGGGDHRAASLTFGGVTGAFEILEHTADVGIRATGHSLEELFAAAGEGLASILGAWFPGEGIHQSVEVEARDRPGLLVAWLDELLYLHEVRDAVFGGFEVGRVGVHDLRARARVAPRGDRELEGVGVKAATYHRLRLGRSPNRDWSADVYLDV
jgi:SHS2 domain-containing protein